VAGRTIKITKKQIQRRKFREALLAFFTRLSNLWHRWVGGLAAPKAGAVRIKPRPSAPNGAPAATTAVAVPGGIKIDTKVKNCPVCKSPFSNDLPVVKCRDNAAHRVHQACSPLVRGKCPLDGHALV